MKFFTTFIFLVLFLVFGVNTAHAQETVTLKGTVISDVQQSEDSSNTTNNVKYMVAIDGFEKSGVDAFADPKMGDLKDGDRILLIKTTESSGQEVYYITDRVRTNSILVLFLIFVGTVVLISKRAGLFSLLGMGYSFLIIFKVLLPLLYSGYNPILVTLFSVVLIAPVSFVLSHGFNNKTFTALAATIVSLTVTSFLALIFINTSHLSGFGTEEAYFLQLAKDSINIRGILLAGIIIGTLGILDDATVTQTSIVAQLKATSRNLGGFELFNRAMAVGHDHIASTVNTLILVYTGASLPLLLLFIKAEETFSIVLNNQIIAEEIVTMLVSSIGLIISIPISTVLAVYFVSKDSESSHHHHH